MINYLPSYVAARNRTTHLQPLIAVKSMIFNTIANVLMPPTWSKGMLNKTHTGQSTALITYRMRFAHIAFQSSVTLMQFSCTEVHKWHKFACTNGVTQICASLTGKAAVPFREMAFYTYHTAEYKQYTNTITDSRPKHVDVQINLAPINIYQIGKGL
jgi:hypothetical protein